MSIGIARFDEHEDLDFVPALVKDVGAVLRELGYDVDEQAHPTLSSSALGAAVTDALAAGSDDDLTIVHLVTHGHLADGNATVFALGSDGVVDNDTSVGHWLEMRQAQERSPTLFLLDLCSAGTTARLPWQNALAGEPRSWVIAACRSDQAAYDGRFTQAMINVLRALRAGELDLDPSVEYVSLATVARAVRQEVNRLAEETGSYTQQVTASLVDLSDDTAPKFFRNPAYEPGDRPRLRADLDPAVLPFLDDLDEGLDARHFLERATGLGRLTDTSTALVGCFTGRDQELREVSPWLNGVGDARLCVVTGSPGSGKSALLGVLVCAANPLLRAATEPIWKKVAQWPLPVPALAAVHARQRGLATIVASVSRQLGLPENLTADELVTLLHKRSDHPVLVVDALDEADGPAEIMTQLLLPLVGSSVRVLVGVRNYPEYAPLFERAWVLDLDDVDPQVLEEDLYKYVNSLLRTTGYRHRGAVIGAFAQAVAAALANGDSTWGPFLVAGLYTRHLVTAFADPVTDPVEAERLGRAVPAGLPAVLELDLRAQPGQVWLRPVLSALAHARGAGMPVSVLARVAAVFASSLSAPTVADIRSALTAGKFYLRQAMDSDRSNVYRLFHQGLADTLAQRPFALAGPYLDALLTRLGPADRRDWEAAEPYLFRHVADHAADADRLADLENDPELFLHPESVLALAAGDSALTDLAAKFAGITTPAELALAAARAGKPELARRAANIPGRVLDWQPRWTLSAPVPRPEPPREQAGDCLLAVSADGTVAATATSQGLFVHKENTAARQLPPLDDITALTLSSDGTKILVGCADGRLVRHHIETGERWTALSEASAPIRAVLAWGDNECVAVAEDGRIAHWPGVDGKVTAVRSDYAGRQWSLAESATRLFAYCVNDGRVLAVNPATGSLDEGFDIPFTDVAAISSSPANVVLVRRDGGAFRYDRRQAIWRRLTSQWAATSVATDSAGKTVLGNDDGLVSIFVGDAHFAVDSVSDAPIAAVAVGDRNTVAAVDALGVVHVRRDNNWTRLSPPTTSDDIRVGTPVVSVLGPSFLWRALIGWSSGFIQEVNLRSGELGDDRHVFDEPVIDIDIRQVAGTDAIRVSTNRRSALITPSAPDLVAVSWRAPIQYAVDTVVHEGKLATAVLNSAGEFHVWHVDDVDGVTPKDMHPHARVVRHGYLSDKAVAFMGGDDGVVRVWDLDSRTVIAELVLGRPIQQIVVGDLLLVRTDREVVAFEHSGAGR